MSELSQIMAIGHGQAVAQMNRHINDNFDEILARRGYAQWRQMWALIAELKEDDPLVALNNREAQDGERCR